MELIIAAVPETFEFDIEMMLREQTGAQPLPFPGMDKSGAAICTYYNSMYGCARGNMCPYRHIKGERTVVCKHWLRGLCKKGDDCEFLHEFDMSKMPECYFFSKFGQCSNKECPFLHIDPEKKLKDCPWYDRGFCRHGPLCKNRHVRRVICQNYVCGFCPDGPNCKFAHPSFDIPGVEAAIPAPKPMSVGDGLFKCHCCGETGHKALACPRNQDNRNHAGGPPHFQKFDNFDKRMRRPLDEVTCYKCGEKGHYANRCPKGHLAFLSNSIQPGQ